MRIASGRRAIWTFRFAVMPGFSRRSSFGTLIIVAYVVTLLTTTGLRRICATCPRKSTPGYASTRKVTSCPGRTRPTSDSSILALTCIFVRSAAMMNSCGAVMLDCTVCPTSTLRCVTMPLMGEVMMV